MFAFFRNESIGMRANCLELTSFLLFLNRKSTFDMFNFLASQHRQLPDIGPYDDEEDEVLLKSTRFALTLSTVFLSIFKH